jgi:hypothetical protein
LSGSGHELRRIENIQKRKIIGIRGRVKKCVRGRRSNGSEFGEKRVVRVERGQWNFGFANCVDGSKSFESSWSETRRRR